MYQVDVNVNQLYVNVNLTVLARIKYLKQKRTEGYSKRYSRPAPTYQACLGPGS